jgi:hypothetical protein
VLPVVITPPAAVVVAVVEPKKNELVLVPKFVELVVPVLPATNAFEDPVLEAVAVKPFMVPVQLALMGQQATLPAWSAWQLVFAGQHVSAAPRLEQEVSPFWQLFWRFAKRNESGSDSKYGFEKGERNGE